MIDRAAISREIEKLFRQFPVVLLVGPRQCGKTTLAKTFLPELMNFFDLEAPVHQTRLRTPDYTLGRLKGLIVLDEIQTMPKLFPILRVLADRKEKRGKFLLLGSASMDLIRGATQTLAGRMATIEMSGFSIAEGAAGKRKRGTSVQDRLWLRGGLPSSYLAASAAQSFTWRRQYVQTFLTRDIPQLGFAIPAAQMHRFWMMLSHYHAQTWNASEIGASLGLTDKTMRHYLDILTGAFLVRQLLPWTENVGKRVRKAPKIYIRDSGVFHALMNLPDRAALEMHPKLGASWEGFAMEQTIGAMGAMSDEVFYWGTHSGAELDLLMFRRGKRLGFEFKFNDAPSLTKSMKQAFADLRLDSLKVVYPGKLRYPLTDKIEVVPLDQVA